jgi:hypothetical protein
MCVSTSPGAKLTVLTFEVVTLRGGGRDFYLFGIEPYEHHDVFSGVLSRIEGQTAFVMRIERDGDFSAILRAVPVSAIVRSQDAVVGDDHKLILS